MGLRDLFLLHRHATIFARLELPTSYFFIIGAKRAECLLAVLGMNRKLFVNIYNRLNLRSYNRVQWSPDLVSSRRRFGS